MNTIEDKQNEKYFYDHCNEFENNHDLVVIVFNKNKIFNSMLYFQFHLNNIVYHRI